jgi:hypothetical protein
VNIAKGTSHVRLCLYFLRCLGLVPGRGYDCFSLLSDFNKRKDDERVNRFVVASNLTEVICNLWITYKWFWNADLFEAIDKHYGK